MKTAESSFLKFIHTGKFGICSKNTRQYEIIDLFPDIWISGKEISPPYKLLIYESLEFVFEHEDFDRVRIRWGDGSDISRWTTLFDVQWYHFIEDLDTDTMQEFLRKYSIAHSCYYFIDDSVAIEIPQSSIKFSFEGVVKKLYRYYRDFPSFRRSPITEKTIDFLPEI